MFGHDFAVPLFVMISGALLLGRQYKIIDFLKKRLSRIIIPFIFWVIITIILGILFLDKGFTYEYCINIFLGMGGSLGVHFWFIWMLIGLYLFIPIINSFVNEYGLKGVEYFLIIWIITIVLNTIGLLPFYKLELSYFTGFLGFTVLGYYLKNKEINIKKTSKKLLFILTIMGFISALLISIYLTNTWSTKSNYVGGNLPIIRLISCTTIFLLFKTFNENTNKLSKFLKDTIIGKITLSLSICSYGIYLVHLVIFYIIKSVYFNPDGNPLKWILFLTLTTLILSWVIILIISKTPYIKKVSGVG